MEFRIAIVEDNATARTALRGHLMSIANLSVSSFASGVELKAALKKQNFELNRHRPQTSSINAIINFTF